MAKRKSLTSTLVWVLMAMLVLGLGGFGMTNLGGQIRSIGTVGGKSVLVDTYGRMLQQEMRSVESRTGESVTLQRAQELGIDRAVLQQLVQMRALDSETDRMGLSVGDEVLRERILQIPGFQGLDGEFDREAYKMTLERTGLSEAEFEAQLREDAARALLQGAVMTGLTMPEIFTDTLVDYVAERRSFTWSLIDGSDMTEPLPEPDAETLKAYYDANIDDFTVPETKKITYAALLPDAILDGIEVPDEDLKGAYDQRSAEFNQPERRLVERLAFLDEESAAQAAAALETGTLFEQLVIQRGLQLSDVDMGDVGAADLGAAGEAVFSAEVGDVVGPAPSPLGPALYRVNAILPAQTITFDEARESLEDELARDRARRQIEAQAQNLEDMLAGGATLEDLAEETDMEPGQIDWNRDTTDGISAYEAFRAAADTVTEDDFPSLIELDDGGLVAMRLDEVVPAHPAEMDDVTEQVRTAWERDEISRRLVARAETVAGEIRDGKDFGDAGLDAVREEGLLRRAPVPQAPAGLIDAVFEMEQGEVRVLPGDASAAIVRLESIDGPAEDAETEQLRAQLQQQADESLAQNVYKLYAAQVTIEARPQIDDQAVQAVHASFR